MVIGRFRRREKHWTCDIPEVQSLMSFRISEDFVFIKVSGWENADGLLVNSTLIERHRLMGRSNWIRFFVILSAPPGLRRSYLVSLLRTLRGYTRENNKRNNAVGLTAQSPLRSLRIPGRVQGRPGTAGLSFLNRWGTLEWCQGASLERQVPDWTIFYNILLPIGRLWLF